MSLVKCHLYTLPFEGTQDFYSPSTGEVPSCLALWREERRGPIKVDKMNVNIILCVWLFVCLPKGPFSKSFKTESGDLGSNFNSMQEQSPSFPCTSVYAVFKIITSW